MAHTNWLKFAGMALALSFGSLAVIPAEAELCGGCLIRPNPKNRNPERREDRPNLPPETDSRDSSVRPPEMPPEETDTRTATMVIDPRSVVVPDDRSRNAPRAN